MGTISFSGKLDLDELVYDDNGAAVFGDIPWEDHRTIDREIVRKLVEALTTRSTEEIYHDLEFCWEYD